MSSEASAALVSSRSTGHHADALEPAADQRALDAGAGEVVLLREEDHLPRHQERDHHAVRERDGGCWPRSPGRWPGCSRAPRSGVARRAFASGGSTACTTSYNISAPSTCSEGPACQVRRGRADATAVRTAQASKGSFGCGGPSDGSTPSNRLLTDSPACTREIASANSSATERTFSSGQSRGGGTVSVVTTSRDHRVVAQPLDRLADEQPVRAGDRRRRCSRARRACRAARRSSRRWRSRRRGRSRACPPRRRRSRR